ncbi:hypothetical protein TRFO_30849 [Tritrichomonas foetus]|uniref:Uncharacterized protein n=1 Tax=Tritrichomonas foetus TaxID=1144522 RepID=A0A1J4JX86_9EUKA|nr:hypothetical protein TRFO_30849 [Tritrichomonas foetus]|eukprot:OHT02148.1 hypothetical protein TRFO_30849 [Tritrichomonas foetus]
MNPYYSPQVYYFTNEDIPASTMNEGQQDGKIQTKRNRVAKFIAQPPPELYIHAWQSRQENLARTQAQSVTPQYSTANRAKRGSHQYNVNMIQSDNSTNQSVEPKSSTMINQSNSTGSLEPNYPKLMIQPETVKNMTDGFRHNCYQEDRMMPRITMGFDIVKRGKLPGISFSSRTNSVVLI